MAPDASAVVEDDALKALREQAEAAEQSMTQLVVASDEKVAALQKEIVELQQQTIAADDIHALQVRMHRYARVRSLLASVDPRRCRRNSLIIQMCWRRSDYCRLSGRIEETLTEFLQIHRDYFGHPMPHLPAETASVENVAALSAMDGNDAGTVYWSFSPQTVNIAGWEWQGWQQSVRYEGSDDSPTVNVLRMQGTWELAGQAVGTTAVAMRYRGLGSIEETFADAGDGTIDRCFTTTEMIPGAAGGSPVISPAVPATVTVGDRGYGFKHRLAAWIGAMARGAGANVVDFQYRPNATYASYPIRQGNLRSCTEAFPGDRHVSQRDEEWFAAGRSFTSTPIMHLVLTTEQPQDRWQSINRWQEVDQHVRDQMSEELGFIPAEPLPAAGYNTDYNWERRIGALAKQIETVLGPAGVRMILQHQPGWLNGRDFARKKDSRFAGGGDCAIYDFRAEGDIAKAWRDVSAACTKWGIDYYAWLSTIAHRGGEFALELDGKQGGMKPSWGEIGTGHWNRGRNVYAFDARNPLFMELFEERMSAARDDLGFQGIWIDSWQKWTTAFSTLEEGRPPMARQFWEMYARWSQQGVALMSESHGFPGLSCSIELPNNHFEDEEWFMQHTVKWFRARERPPGAGTEDATAFTFRMMANKSTVCWNTEGQDDLGEVVPEFDRLAHEYLAALPMMRRSYVLPNGAGMLWLGYDNDSEGIWYPFAAGCHPNWRRSQSDPQQGCGSNGASLPYLRGSG